MQLSGSFSDVLIFTRKQNGEEGDKNTNSELFRRSESLENYSVQIMEV